MSPALGMYRVLAIGLPGKSQLLIISTKTCSDDDEDGDLSGTILNPLHTYPHNRPRK